MSLTHDEINEMKSLAQGLKSLYGPSKELLKRIEEAYFMDNPEKPKGLNIDDKDIKVTISPTARNKATGLKRILDTGEVQIKVKDGDNVPKSDEIEAALKTMLQVSNESRIASIEKDENLGSILYGSAVLTADSIDDLITAKTKDADGNDKEGINKFVVRQLEGLKKRTPFIIGTINTIQSYPEFGEYGLVGHLRIYDVRGNVLKERWGCSDASVKVDQKYEVWDFFHYDKRLTWAAGVDGELYAGVWMDVSTDDVPQIPIFVRYGGGSSLWYEPERQIQPFLYPMVKGDWDKRENLYWTYLFTAIYRQGLPGPAFIRDPQSTAPVKVIYDNGIKIIEGVGKLENITIIDRDSVQLKQLMDKTAAENTIQPEAFGAGADNTFSGYITAMNASKLPSEDPKEGIAKVFRDMFLYILKRIKAEGTDNKLISPADIPDDIDLEVTYEPNLTQDNLRNAQILTQLKAAGANLSDEWMDTNIMKIPDSEAMFKQKTKEDIRKAMVQMILQDKEKMQPIIMAAMGQKQPQPQPQPDTPMPPSSPDMGQGDTGMPPDSSALTQGEGMEAMPKTDAMIPTSERT